MKPRIALLILLGSLVGLLLLIRATPVTPAVRPTVAVTVTPAPTIVVLSRTPLPSPTATQPPPTATEALADTVTATQLPSATLPSIKGSVADYELTVPPAGALLDLYVEAQRHNLNITQSSDAWIGTDASGLNSAIVYALHHYYPKGLPSPKLLLDLDWQGEYSNPPFDSALFTSAVLDYLQGVPLVDNQSLSTPAFMAEVHKVELDGDAQPEWLLRLTSGKFRLNDWLTVDEISPGVFRRLNSDMESSEIFGPFDAAYYIDDLEDLTGDGRTDLVLSQDNVMMDTHLGSVGILKGTPQGFKRLSGFSTDGTIFIDPPEYQLAHSPRTGQVVLNLTRYNNLNWGCAWKTEETYSWPNGFERHTVEGKEPPDTPECAVAKAVSTLVKPPANPTAIGLLESALKAFATKPSDSPDYELFVHYRLAVLYALQGEQAAARRHLLWLKTFADTTIANAQDTDYADFVRNSVETELAADRVSPIRLCDAMAKHTDLMGKRLSYLDSIAATHNYPYGPDAYPPAFCPLGDVLKQILPKIQMATNTSLEVAFGQVGLKLVDAEPLKLAAGAQAWTVVLQLGDPRLVTIIKRQAPTIDHVFRGAKGNLISLDKDLTGDSVTDRAFAYQVEPNYICESDKTAYDVVAVMPQLDQTLKTVANVECFDAGTPFDLPTLLADKNGDNISDWVKARLAAEQNAQYQPDRDPAWLNFDTVLALKSSENELDGIRNLDSAFYKDPTSAQTLSLLQKALVVIPANDPNAPRVRQHLNYLIAMSYELEGNDALAVQTYYDIWADPTPTLWGNLAAIHLAHK